MKTLASPLVIAFYDESPSSSPGSGSPMKGTAIFLSGGMGKSEAPRLLRGFTPRNDMRKGARSGVERVDDFQAMCPLATR